MELHCQEQLLRSLRTRLVRTYRAAIPARFGAIYPSSGLCTPALGCVSTDPTSLTIGRKPLTSILTGPLTAAETVRRQAPSTATVAQDGRDPRRFFRGDRQRNRRRSGINEGGAADLLIRLDGVDHGRVGRDSGVTSFRLAHQAQQHHAMDEAVLPRARASDDPCRLVLERVRTCR